MKKAYKNSSKTSKNKIFIIVTDGVFSDAKQALSYFDFLKKNGVKVIVIRIYKKYQSYYRTMKDVVEDHVTKYVSLTGFVELEKTMAKIVTELQRTIISEVQ